MTMTAAELVASKKHILLDFDGPICAAFAGYGAANISRQLAILLTQGGDDVPRHLFHSSDPFELLRFAAACGDPERLADVDTEFRRLEILAVRIAPPTPYASEFISRMVDLGRTITVVSNNSVEAVRTYLGQHELARSIVGVSARVAADPSLLKPNPHLLLDAISALCARPVDCVIVGDSVSDIHAARAAGVQAIAFANKEGKEQLLSTQGASALVTSMLSLIS